MKTLKRRIIAVAAFMCVAMASFTSCAGSKSSTDKADVAGDDVIEVVTNAEGNMIAAPFQDGTPVGGNIQFGGKNINAPDPVATEPATEYVPVTDASGEGVTEFIPVTEAGGQSVTESGGNVVTTAVPVTEAVTLAPVEDNYVDDTIMRYIFWLDIEDDVDYTFNGQFVKLSFRVKDDAAERVYPIAIDPDISTVGGKSLNRDIKVFNGAIGVGKDAGTQDVSNVTGPVVYAEKKTVNKGDTFDYYVYFDKNPGVAAIMMWISYDANALEWLGTKPCGEFEPIAEKRKPETGTNPANTQE
ncbi:MAG: hypothetical protein IKO47_06510 [Ruminococcus sp.]|nr:hypothetical protein [Ruminococcus sp.]